MVDTREPFNSHRREGQAVMSMNGRNGHAEEIGALRVRWEHEARWQGIERSYTPQDVLSLRGSLKIEHPVARAGAERLWSLLHSEPVVRTFGALTGAQAVQMVKAGLKAVYLSGWQVAADANQAAQTYPDQSLYPSNSVPQVVKRINNALIRADQIANLSGPPGHALVCADRRRRRGRVRRADPQLRVDEGDDRGGRGRRPL